MPEAEFETFTCNEFTVQQFGTGEPHAAFIGGITYAPSDFGEVAKRMPGTNFVLNNPIHTGEAKRSKEGIMEDMQHWKDWLRQKYTEVLRELRCPLIISHSLGTLYTSKIHTHVQGLRGFVLANPPTNTRGAYAEKSRMDEFEFLDRCIADCCTDIADEKYRAMLSAHQLEYVSDAPKQNLKSIFRLEIPHPIADAVEDMMNAVRESTVPVLFITGKSDPWNGNNLEKVTSLNHVSHAELETNHFPHISNPEAFLESVETWKADLQTVI